MPVWPFGCVADPDIDGHGRGRAAVGDRSGRVFVPPPPAAAATAAPTASTRPDDGREFRGRRVPLLSDGGGIRGGRVPAAPQLCDTGPNLLKSA